MGKNQDIKYYDNAPAFSLYNVRGEEGHVIGIAGIVFQKNGNTFTSQTQIINLQSLAF